MDSAMTDRGGGDPQKASGPQGATMLVSGNEQKRQETHGAACTGPRGRSHTEVLVCESRGRGSGGAKLGRG